MLHGAGEMSPGTVVSPQTRSFSFPRSKMVTLLLKSVFSQYILGENAMISLFQALSAHAEAFPGSPLSA